MLRLQPTELGLTMKEVTGVAHRLQMQREARRSAASSSMPCSYDHPRGFGNVRLRRGPERSRDDDLTIPFTRYFHSVATSSDGEPFEDVAACGLYTEQPRSGSSKASLDEATFRLNPFAHERDSAPDSEAPETVGIGVSGPEAGDTRQAPNDGACRRGLPHLLQLDGAEATSIQPLRRFHAHSLSDPSQGIPQLTVAARRTVRNNDLPSQRRRSSSTFGTLFDRDSVSSFHSRSQSAVLQRSSDVSNYSTTPGQAAPTDALESILLKRSLSGSSVVLKAIKDSISPLDALSRECAVESSTQAAWHGDLPIRLSSQRASQRIRWPTFSSDSDNESPTSPNDRSMLISPSQSEEDELLTPRACAPPTPRLRRAELSPSRSVPLGQCPSDASAISPSAEMPSHHRHLSRNENDTSSPSPHRIRRRPVPVIAASMNDHYVTRHFPVTYPSQLPEARVPRLSDADVPRQILLRQQANFYNTLAQINDGNLPADAHAQWLQYIQHLITTPSPSYDMPHRTPALRRRPRGSDILQSSESAGNRNFSDPFDSSPPFSSSLERADPRGMNLEFSVARGGRPRHDSTWRAPIQTSRANVPRGGASQGSSFDQENIDGGEAWARFEQERSRNFRAAAASGNGANDDATPPGVGRLGRYL